MHFGEIKLLMWLWLIIPFAIFLWWTYRRYLSKVALFIDPKLLNVIIPFWKGQRMIIKNVLLIIIVAMSIFALSRPQWGFEWQEVKRQGIDILVVVDVSKSMLTTDIRPNRLERTKFAIKDLLKKLQGDRIGLVAFAGDAFLVCPLTVDYNGFLLSLNDLGVNTVPRGGTNISKAIEESLRNYGEEKSTYKSVIIVTDGDDLEGNASRAAEKAKEKGIKIYTVGIGTPEGELIQIENEVGEKEFLKDMNGNFVKSRLNEKLLQEIAVETDGMYVRASGVQFGLDLIYERELSKIEKREFENKMEKRYYERFQIPLAFVFMLLLWETLLSTYKVKKNGQASV